MTIDMILSANEIEYGIDGNDGRIVTIYIHQKGVDTQFDIANLVSFVNNVDDKSPTMTGVTASDSMQEIHDFNMWWFMQNLKGEMTGPECLKTIELKIESIAKRFNLNLTKD